MWSVFVFFFKQKTAYEMRISDWSSDVCSSDLPAGCVAAGGANPNLFNCPYQINRRSNGDGGRNQGFEFQVSRPIWGGFGAVFNYTYSDAKANNGDPIPGNSKHSLNLTGYYENDLVSARLSYNYRSKFFIDIDRRSEEHTSD